MKVNLVEVQKYRQFTEEFKKQIVKDFESGQYSVIELERLHGISNKSIYNWIYKYSTFNKKGYRIVESKLSSSNKVKELEKKVKDLEAALGRKQIMIDYLETMIDVAKDELNYDIKKNYNTLPSANSKKGK